MIFCATHRNVSEKNQMLARCSRKGQTKAVHVYEIEAANSMIDALMTNGANKKEKVVYEMMRYLRRPENELLVFPFINRIFTSGAYVHDWEDEWEDELST
jgi:hypothetical protein